MGRGLGIEPSGRGMVGHAGAVLLHRAADRGGWWADGVHLKVRVSGPEPASNAAFWSSASNAPLPDRYLQAPGRQSVPLPCAPWRSR